MTWWTSRTHARFLEIVKRAYAKPVPQMLRGHVTAEDVFYQRGQHLFRPPQQPKEYVPFDADEGYEKE